MELEASLAYHILRNTPLTLTLLTCRIWWAPNNVNKWQMGLNSVFEGLSPVLNLINPVHILRHINLEPTLILSSLPHQNILIGLCLSVLAPQLYICFCTPPPATYIMLIIFTWDYSFTTLSEVYVFSSELCLKLHQYRGADKSLARPTSRCILFDG
jgi:hypothetical protein